MSIDLPGLATLLGYCISLAGFIPLFPHLPPVPQLLFPVAFAAGVLIDRKKLATPPGWLLTSAAIMLFLWYAAQFSRHNPAVPVISVLSILLSVRLVAEKSARTWLQVYALSLFALSASSIFDLGPRFLFWLVLLLCMIALSLVLLTFQAADSRIAFTGKALRQVIFIGLAIPVISLLIAPLFFPVLPRTRLPLWHFLHQGTARQTGLSDSVAPGTVTQVSETGVLAFRAEMKPLPPQQLYWRGAVFSGIVSGKWIRDSRPAISGSRPSGAKVLQTVSLEPGGTGFLITLDAPSRITPLTGSRTVGHTVSLPAPPKHRMRYQVQSSTGGLLEGEPAADLKELLTVPPDTGSAIRKLGVDIGKKGKNNAERLELTEVYYRNAGLRYATSELPVGSEALEQFLFRGKRGHCELFASSFALVLRAAGIPSRLVGGYLGGEYNELGGYYRVGEERAHVWVEAWIAGRGWVRIDPSTFAINADSLYGNRNSRRSVLLRVRLFLDNMDHIWNSAVITYDFEQQLKGLSNIGDRLQNFRISGIRQYSKVAAGAAVTVMLIWFLARFWRNAPGQRERLLRSLRLKLEKNQGIPASERLGLFELADRSNTVLVRRFVEIYAGSLYRDRNLSDQERKELADIIRQI